MRITEIAESTNRPEKVLGLHYFNPAVMMKLVEVIRGDKTSDETMKIGYDYVLKNNRIPVKVNKDVPGFIVNRVNAAAVPLLGAILDDGRIEPEAVDATVRKLGAPMGPYETMDFSGLDIWKNGSDYFSKTVHPDFETCVFIKNLVMKNKLGKKSGKGIFDWSNGRPKIDLEKATAEFNPIDLSIVCANEATKIIAEGACSLEDIDLAIKNANNAPAGPIEMVQQFSSEELTERLEKLAGQFDKEIFKPTGLIKSGGYKLTS